jgi:ElaB/YqjD/DUF883 family membrane-anchored ribosome-binding protein
VADADKALVPARRATIDVVAQVKVDLEAAQLRAARSIDAVEASVGKLDWRATVRRNPWLAVGGALAVGWALGRLFAPTRRTRTK